MAGEEDEIAPRPETWNGLDYSTLRIRTAIAQALAG
jgi:hypothetical protein